MLKQYLHKYNRMRNMVLPESAGEQFVVNLSEKQLKAK
jgi:hypothetical protein